MRPALIMVKGILFICLGNSCRSIMAEALARRSFPNSVSIGSAGLNPLGYVAPETLQVLAEAGVGTAGLRSKGLEEIDGAAYSLLVNLTDGAVEAPLPGNCTGRILDYPVTDPFGRSLETYRQVRETLRHFINEDLLPLLGEDS